MAAAISVSTRARFGAGAARSTVSHSLLSRRRWWYTEREAMEIEEALAILQIAHEVTPKEAHRAYLRLVKRHGPERDPEGFRRIRAAYEQVERFVRLPPEYRAHLRLQVPPRATSSPAPGEVNALDPAGAAADPSAALPGDAAPSSGATLDAAAPIDDGSGSEEDDSADHPAEAPAPDEEVPDYPDEGSAEDVERWLERAYPWLLQRFEDRGDAFKPTWPARRALGLLLTRGDWQRASALAAAVARWQREDASLRDVFRGAIAARWALLSELSVVGPKLPVRLARALAAGIVNENANLLTIKLAQFRERFPHEASAALHTTAAAAPTLHGVLRTHLPPAAAPQARPLRVGTMQFPFFGVLSMLLVVGNFARLCMQGERSSSSASNPIHFAATSPSPAEEPPRPGRVDFTQVLRAHETLERLARESRRDALIESNHRVLVAFQEGSCPRLVATFGALEHTTRGEAPALREEVQRYWAEVLIRCPDEASQLPKANDAP